jgi:hypothetical protein
VITVDYFCSRPCDQVLPNADGQHRRRPSSGHDLHALCYFIDLAGSERNSLSWTTGRELTVKPLRFFVYTVLEHPYRSCVNPQEACYVNRSLTALGQVITSISQGDPHIPFRLCKVRCLRFQSLHPAASCRIAQLTQVLEPSLSQQGAKAVMIVNVAEDTAFRDASLQSLRFAETVANCKGGPSVKSSPCGL